MARHNFTPKPSNCNGRKNGQLSFSFDDRPTAPPQHRYRSANLEDEATSGLIQVWGAAVANGWRHLSDLARGQLEREIRGQQP